MNRNSTKKKSKYEDDDTIVVDDFAIKVCDDDPAAVQEFARNEIRCSLESIGVDPETVPIEEIDRMVDMAFKRGSMKISVI